MVPDGQARAAAEELARQIAAFPQTCMRSDRASAYECVGAAEREALAIECGHGVRTLSSPDVRGKREGEGRKGGGGRALTRTGAGVARGRGGTGDERPGKVRGRGRTERQVLRALSRAGLKKKRGVPPGCGVGVCQCVLFFFYCL